MSASEDGVPEVLKLFILEAREPLDEVSSIVRWLT
jgi:hypothetical protein